MYVFQVISGLESNFSGLSLVCVFLGGVGWGFGGGDIYYTEARPSSL